MSNKIIRCGWCSDDPEYQAYHDTEWGKHTSNEQTLFEFLVLESAQAGLSWITILKRRDGYKRLFANFDPHLVSQFTDADVERIVLDPAIIRHRGKIVAAIENAKVFLNIQKEFGSFYNYLYTFMPEGKPYVNKHTSLATVHAKTKESDAISKDLKKRGVKFFGSTICYAYMQAIGMVNDHIKDCSYRFK